MLNSGAAYKADVTSRSFPRKEQVAMMGPDALCAFIEFPGRARALLVFDTTLTNIVMLGEMAARVSETTKSLGPLIEWPEIRALLNLVVRDSCESAAER